MHGDAPSWLIATLVLAAAAILLGLAWYLWGDPDRSDRLRARFARPLRYFYPAAAALFALGAVFEASHDNWGHAPFTGVMALTCLICWRNQRRDAAKTPSP